MRVHLEKACILYVVALSLWQQEIPEPAGSRGKLCGLLSDLHNVLVAALHFHLVQQQGQLLLLLLYCPCRRCNSYINLPARNMYILSAPA